MGEHKSPPPELDLTRRSQGRKPSSIVKQTTVIPAFQNQVGAQIFAIVGQSSNTRDQPAAVYPKSSKHPHLLSVEIGGSVFTQEVLNGFAMIKRPATREIPAVRQGFRAFVGVYPPSSRVPAHQWLVRRFEIPEGLVEEYFGEEVLLDSQMFDLQTLEEVEEILAKWHIDSAAFEAPWKNDWPL
jgi:hypothetical protein